MDGFHAQKNIREIKGFDCDPVTLQSDLVNPYGFERRGARPDRAHDHTLYTAHHPADAIKLIHIGLEILAARFDRVRLERSKLDTILAEHIHDRELSTE